MDFAEWFLKEEQDVVKVQNAQQLGAIEKIVPTVNRNIFWVKNKQSPQPFRADLSAVHPNIQRQLVTQYQPKKTSPDENASITLYRGVRGQFRFLSPEELKLKSQLNAMVEKHSNKHGAVGLQQWRHWPKYLELNKIDTNQTFSDQKNDAVDYASRGPNGGQVITLQVPRKALLNNGIEFGAPTLRSTGGGGQVAIIPPNILQQLMQKYPHNIENVQPAVKAS